MPLPVIVLLLSTGHIGLHDVEIVTGIGAVELTDSDSDGGDSEGEDGRGTPDRKDAGPVHGVGVGLSTTSPSDPPTPSSRAKVVVVSGGSDSDTLSKV